MRFLKLTIAYDGTNYIGWQVQPTGASIQSELEAAWQKLTGESRRITASGRTDSGVHAEGQVCSLATDSTLPDRTIRRGLNALLPPDIAVVQCQSMPEDFHAIRDAVAKTYRYQIQSGPVRNVLRHHHWWYVPPALDRNAMQQGADALIGRHDFAAFQTTGSARRSTVRNITDFRVEEERDGPYSYFRLTVTADGFLYNMVRCLAGTLAVVGKGRQAPEWVSAVLQSRDRAFAGATAPPQGLFLVRVFYPAKFSNGGTFEPDANEPGNSSP